MPAIGSFFAGFLTCTGFVDVLRPLVAAVFGLIAGAFFGDAVVCDWVIAAPMPPICMRSIIRRISGSAIIRALMTGSAIMRLCIAIIAADDPSIPAMAIPGFDIPDIAIPGIPALEWSMPFIESIEPEEVLALELPVMSIPAIPPAAGAPEADAPPGRVVAP